MSTRDDKKNKALAATSKDFVPVEGMPRYRPPRVQNEPNQEENPDTTTAPHYRPPSAEGAKKKNDPATTKPMPHGEPEPEVVELLSTLALGSTDQEDAGPMYKPPGTDDADDKDAQQNRQEADAAGEPHDAKTSQAGSPSSPEIKPYNPLEKSTSGRAKSPEVTQPALAASQAQLTQGPPPQAQPSPNKAPPPAQSPAAAFPPAQPPAAQPQPTFSSPSTVQPPVTQPSGMQSAAAQQHASNHPGTPLRSFHYPHFLRTFFPTVWNKILIFP